MAFRTKIDYSNNRQIKQREQTFTTLSGSSTFGVPFSALTTGPDLNTVTIIDDLSGLTGTTFSGNETTTIFNFADSRMNLAVNSLSAVTPSNFNIQQNTGDILIVENTTLLDGNLINLSYSGVSFTLDVETFVDLGGVYTGTVEHSEFYIISADTLGYKERTIWVDNPEITRTDRLIVSRGAQAGYILTSNDEGMGSWVEPTSGTGLTEVISTCQTTLTNNTDVYAIIDTSSGPYNNDGDNRILLQNSLSEWFNNFKISNPDYTGKLYIGYSNSTEEFSEGYVNWLTLIRSQDTSNRTTFINSFVQSGSGTTSSSQTLSWVTDNTPPNWDNLNWISPNEIFLISFVNESNSDYHGGSTPYLSGEPYSLYNTHFSNFKADYAQMNFFSGIIYPLFDTTTSSPTQLSFLIHAYCVLKAPGAIDLAEFEILTGPNYDSSFDTLGTTNPYSDYLGENIGLTQYNWGGVLNKRTDSLGILTFTPAEFENDINNILESSGSELNTADLIDSYTNDVLTLRGLKSSTIDFNVDAFGCLGMEVNGFSSSGTTFNNMVYLPDLTITNLTSVSDLQTNINGKLINGISDINFKTNINNLESALDKIKKLRGVSFNWTPESEMGEGINFGLIAQEVEEVIPEMVKPICKGSEHLTLDYKSIVPWLIEAIKELSQTNSSVFKNTEINTQTIASEDNDIVLNFNGNHDSALNGGLVVNSGVNDKVNSQFIINSEGDWITNTYIKPHGIVIPDFTPKSSYDITGKIGEITRDDDYFYIKGNDGQWKRSKLETF
jgi:hypothetical protein